MRERFTGDTEPERRGWNAVRIEQQSFQRISPSASIQSSLIFDGLPRHRLISRLMSHASNTFVVIRTEAVISLLKTWVSADTVKNVLVSRECRFVWQ
jgi:hypothetical protein